MITWILVIVAYSFFANAQVDSLFQLNSTVVTSLTDAGVVREEGSSETHFVLHFENPIDVETLNDNGLDQQFSCEDIFDIKIGDENVLDDINCKFCLQNSAEDIIFLTLEGSALENEIPTGLKLRGSNESFTEIFDPNEKPSFEVIKVVQTNMHSFALVFNQNVHLVRNGFGGVKNSFSAFCEEIFLPFHLDEPVVCTFEFQDNLVHVQLENGVKLPTVISFLPNLSSFFSVDDKFGLRPPSNDSFIIREQPKLIENEHLLTEESLGSVLFTFDQPLLAQDVDRVLCSDILEYKTFDEDEEVELFSERDDLFCSLKFNSNQVQVGFPEIMAMFPFDDIGVSFHFQFKELTLFLSEDGLSTAINDEKENLIFFSSKEEVYQNINFKVIGPTNELSKCDTEFRLEVVQISGVNLRFSLVALGDDICDLIDTTVICSTESFNETSLIVHEFLFRVDAVFVQDIFSEFIGLTETFLVSQNFGEQKIPVQVAGIQLDEGVVVKRGDSLSLTAVLAESVFECGGGSVASQKIDFSWRIVEDIDNEFSSSSKIFRLPENSLEIGEYSILLTAVGDPSLGLSPNTISLSLSVVATEIFLVSTSGSDIIVATNTPTAKVELNALRSCNANVINGCVPGLGLADEDIEELALLAPDEQIAKLGLTGFNLKWKCINCDEGEELAIFDNVNRSVPLLDIPLVNFDFITSFETTGRALQEEEDDVTSQFNFAFEVTDENDEAVVAPLEMNLNLVTPPDECILPEIELLPVDPVVNTDSGLSIIAIVTNSDAISENITFLWTAEEDGLLFQPDIVLNRETLFIPADTLSEGASYLFRIDASVECAEVAEIEIFATTVFETNIRPFGGLVDVQPKNGSALEKFTITTVGWTDPNGNIPLEFAFDIIYLTEEELANFEDIPAQRFSPLSQFSQSVSFTTNLQVAPENKTGVIVALARDSLGAISRRAVVNTVSDFIVLNPFDEEINVEEIRELIDDLKNTGDSAQVPNLCSAIGSSLNSLPEDSIAELGQDAVRAREVCLDSIFDVIPLDGDLDDLALDPDVVNLVATSLSTLTEKPDQIGLDTLSNVAELTDVLVGAMEQEVINALRVENDPAAAAIIPESFRENIADTVSNVLGVTNFQVSGNVSDAVEVSGEAKGQIISVTESSRKSIENVGILQTAVLVPGAPQVTAESTNVKLAALREDINAIGQATGQIVVPDGVEGANAINLPDTFSNDLNANNLDSNDALSIVAIKYSSPIIFDRDLVKMERDDCSYAKYVYDGPLEGTEGNILALDFFSIGNQTSNAVELVVEDLVEPIVLLLDVPVEVVDLKEVASIQSECDDVITELNEISETREAVASISFEDTCGFFLDNDFTTEFCETGSLINGKLECRCVHATDFGAWKALKYDVSRTLLAQIELSPLVAKIFKFGIPLLLTFIALLFSWAYFQDRRDEEIVLKAVLSRVKLMRLVKEYQKKKVFKNIEDAKIQQMAGIHDENYDTSSIIFNEKILRTFSNKEVMNKIYAGKEYWFALRYEHSVFGLSRYDPNLSRFKRATLFVAVVIATFGTAAMLFELRDAKASKEYRKMNFLLTLSISVGGAILSSIPLKIVAKTLLRTTDNVKGSTPDLINCLYKILYRIEQVDGVSLDTDTAFVDAVYDLVVAKLTLKRHLQRVENTDYADDTTSDGKKDDLQVTFAHNDNLSNFSNIDELTEQYLNNLNNAKERLDVAIDDLKIGWANERSLSKRGGSKYTSWNKIRIANSQPNGFLKVSSAMSGKPSKAAKGRDSRLPSYYVVLDWLFVLLFVVFYSNYILRFLGTREVRANDGYKELLGIETKQEPKTEVDFIIEWAKAGALALNLSYLVFEPAISMIRFVVLPYLVSKLGCPYLPNELILKELKDEHEAEDQDKEKGKDKESKSSALFDTFIDVFENL